MIKSFSLILILSALMLEGCAHTQKMDTGPVQTVAIPAYIPTEINVNNQGLLEFMGNFIQLPAELQKKNSPKSTWHWRRTKTTLTIA